MPSKPPPSFGSQEYWNTRFTSNADPFEWLESPDTLDASIADALESAKVKRPELLHIGCGTSLLSYHLRSHVEQPRQIHNLDYSHIAIDIGQKREHELYDVEENVEEQQVVEYMRWDTVDLLQHTSLLSVCKRNAYSILVDKSTSDAIACSDDIFIPLPYPVTIQSYAPVDLERRQPSEPVHPLYVMAVNLALVAKSGARWIALSYSNDRFPFFSDQSDPANTYIQEGALPDPCKLWKLVEKREIEETKGQPSADGRKDTITHRAKVLNWLYVLERSDIPLFVRGEHI